MDLSGGVNSGAKETPWVTDGKNYIEPGKTREAVEKLCQARIATAINLCKNGSPSIDFDKLDISEQKVLVDVCYNMAGGK